jgi:pimeloyl-ACP methyl ester carboxylesterase
MHPITESFVFAGGTRFHLASCGPPDGPLVLLLHGFPERWTSFEQILPRLAARGLRACAPDLRGYGLSDKPETGYDLPTLAADIAALIHALGHGHAQADLVGHDWGGAITWETASRFPALVRRFAVINGPHPAAFLRTVLRSPAQLRKSWYMLFFQIPAVPEWLLTRDPAYHLARAILDPQSPPGAAPTRQEIGPMLAYYRTAVRGNLRHPLRAARQLRSYPVLEQPGLLLWSEADAALGLDLVPAHVPFARDLSIHRFPGRGHFLHQEAPAEIANLLIDFFCT